MSIPSGKRRVAEGLLATVIIVIVVLVVLGWFIR